MAREVSSEVGIERAAPIGSVVQELRATLESASLRVDRIAGRARVVDEDKRPDQPARCLLDTLDYHLHVLMDLATHIDKMSVEIEARLEGLK